MRPNLPVIRGMFKFTVFKWNLFLFFYENIWMCPPSAPYTLTMEKHRVLPLNRLPEASREWVGCQGEELQQLVSDRWWSEGLHQDGVKEEGGIFCMWTIESCFQNKKELKLSMGKDIWLGCLWARPGNPSGSILQNTERENHHLGWSVQSSLPTVLLSL